MLVPLMEEVINLQEEIGQKSREIKKTVIEMKNDFSGLINQL